ncbi:50S ribosomal protein L10 [Candidatus Roizmanbacteria bacterium]|nr:50S ribosomal protein L10 [Candidatus Roizmanbacteria bacterium]
MPNKKKLDAVSKLTAELSSYDTIVLSDYTGLTHQQLEEIRKEIKRTEALFRIVKNKLLKIALSEAQLPGTDRELLGPTGVLLAKATNLSSLALLYNKGKELDTFKLKWGLWNKNLITQNDIIRLATLPSREMLIAQLLGQLKSPQTRLVLTLKGNLQKLVIALDEIRKQQEVNSHGR